VSIDALSNGFQIGAHKIWPPVALAPMEGVTDRPFRAVIRSLGGVGLTVTEFVSSEAMTRDVRDAWRMAELDPGEHPVSIQIYGRDPDRMAQAARFCQGLGADIVDINLGCPSKRVTSGCAGSALMREPVLANEIFDAVAGAVSVPWSVKMRLGWDHSDYTAPQIAAAAQARGAQLITVHGRTKSDAYRYPARWAPIRQVRDAISVPLLVNGDIVDATTARQALAESGADGIMIGRAVMSDPWALRRISAELYGGELWEPTADDRKNFLFRYLDEVEIDAEHEGRDEPGRRSLAKLRKVIGYFSRGMHGSARLRAALQSVETTAEARAMIGDFFARSFFQGGNQPGADVHPDSPEP